VLQISIVIIHIVLDMWCSELQFIATFIIFFSGHVKDNCSIIIKEGQTCYEFLLSLIDNVLFNGRDEVEHSGVSVVLLYFFLYFIGKSFGVTYVSFVSFVQEFDEAEILEGVILVSESKTT